MAARDFDMGPRCAAAAGAACVVITYAVTSARCDRAAVDVDEALAALPAPYALALGLDADGEDIDAIAAALGLDAATVPALLEIGRRKLDSLVRGD